MSHILKFRAYSHTDKAFHYFDIYEGYPTGIYSAMSEPEQFTGVSDINNVEIFEDDIVEYTVKDWDTEEFDKYIGRVCREDSYFTCGDYKLFAVNSVKVIGNVHQNPELFKS